jgi:hypothetical protein
MLSSEGGAQYIGNAAIAVRDMATLKAAAWTKAGQLYDLQSYVSLANGGRGYWLAVNSSGVVTNGIDVVQSTPNPEVAFVFQPTNGVVDIRQLGAIGGGDVTAILNQAMSSNAYRIVTASKLLDDAPFICSDTVYIKKSFICTGSPQFDFASTTLLTPSFFTGDAGTTDDVEYSGFEILNSQHAALRGKGDRVLINRVKVINAYLQGINWQGVQYKITNCYVSGVAKEFGILNGGISRDVEIAFNYVEYTALGGGIEYGYTASNSTIHHNSIRNCYVGIQVYMHTTGTVSSAFDALVSDNIITGSTLHGIQVLSGTVGDSFILRGLRIERNNINTAGVTGILVQGGSTDTLLIDNVITDITSNIGVRVVAFDGYLEISGGYIARCSQGMLIEQDGVEINDVRMFNITYDAFLWPAGNSFKNQSIRGCYLRTIGRDFIRNFNYASYPLIKDFNNIKMPLSSFAQMNGATVVGGQIYYIDTATSGQAPGFYIIASGVVGVGAAARNLAAISST